MLIDTHAHLTDPKFDEDRDAVLTRAAEQGVRMILVVGDTVDASQAALTLAAGQPGRLFGAAGVHPHHGATFDGASLVALRRLTAHPACVAVGEIGLDYHYDFSPREAQRYAFAAQLDLARERDLPVILHCREAFDDLFAILSDHPVAGDDGPGGVLHCFTGDAEQARRAVDMGLRIGVAGMITFKKADALRQALAEVPLERLVVETDAPYLAPHPHRGRRNEPAFTVHTALALAQLRGVSAEQMMAITTENARRLFRLPAGSEA